MSAASRRAAAAACWLALIGASAAHVRLLTGGGKPIYWDAEDSVPVVIQAAGSDDVPDASDAAALRLAIDAWNRATGSTAELVEDTSPDQQARTDWESDSIHLLYFDEDDSSGYFPGDSQIVAVTPVWFFASGRISDADVLFNGDDFEFTTSGEAGRFDVQAVAAHELGHLLGLDHSGVAGAAMYPYLDTEVILQRSLALDDEGGLRDAYPAQSFGTLAGIVRRSSDGTTVAGAHVVALDAAGRTAGAALANGSGEFALRGLPSGAFSVYAAPLDGPVKAGNLSFSYTVDTDFEPASYAEPAEVAAGTTADLGELLVGGDVVVSLGRASDELPLRAISGETSSHQLTGAALVPGSTLTSSDSEVAVTPIHWGGVLVTFAVEVPVGAAPGHFDLTVVTPAGDTAVLPAAVEITPPSPAVASVEPVSGSASGGTHVLISGTGFRPGARVVIGDRVYADGEGETAVLFDQAIELTTLPTLVGQHDVVVIDETGVEGRLSGAFGTGHHPSIDVVFPQSGQSSGGTRVVISGSDFDPGLAVRIDGTPQLDIDVVEPDRVVFWTEGGMSGGPYLLELENPGSAIASAGFAYVLKPDPVAAQASPGAGSGGGGETIALHGTGFTSATEVVFGADPDTGAGGTPAALVALVDANTLEVVTPAHSKGAVSVLTTDAGTGQAAVLEAGFNFSGGGGGGCASIAGPRAPAGPHEIAAGAWFWAALLLIFAARAGRARPAAAQR